MVRHVGRQPCWVILFINKVNVLEVPDLYLATSTSKSTLLCSRVEARHAFLEWARYRVFCNTMLHVQFRIWTFKLSTTAARPHHFQIVDPFQTFTVVNQVGQLFTTLIQFKSWNYACNWSRVSVDVHETLPSAIFTHYNEIAIHTKPLVY